MIMRGIGGLIAVGLGCILATGCSTLADSTDHDAWRKPAIGDGTADLHVKILSGTTDGGSQATVQASYRCPASSPAGGEITAILAIASTGAHSVRDHIPITCDGIEHPFAADFDGAFPAGDLMVYGDYSLQLPDSTTPTPGATPATAAELQASLREVAGDHAHILALKTKQ